MHKGCTRKHNINARISEKAHRSWMLHGITCHIQSVLPNESSLTTTKSEPPAFFATKFPSVRPASTIDPSSPTATPTSSSLSGVPSCYRIPARSGKTRSIRRGNVFRLIYIAHMRIDVFIACDFAEVAYAVNNQQPKLRALLHTVVNSRALLRSTTLLNPCTPVPSPTGYSNRQSSSINHT